MQLIEHNPSFPIGLDISDHAFKFVQLSKNRDKLNFQAIGKTSFSEGIIEDGQINDLDEAVKNIKNAISKPIFGKINNIDVVACLPEPVTFIKLIEVEKTANKLSNSIGTEIQKHIPFLLKNIYFDWQIIKEKKDSFSVLVGACPRKVVDDYLKLLNLSGLNIIALEIEALSIARSLLIEERPKFHNNNQGSNYLIMDIGAKRSSVFVYAAGSIVLSLSVPISGIQATKNISKTLEITEDQAEKAKIMCGLDKNKAKGIVKKVLSEDIDGLLDKIIHIADYYDNHYSHFGPITKIILCGGGANIKNIDKVINDTVHIPVEAGDPFINLAIPNDKVSRIFTEEYKINEDPTSENKKTIKLEQSTTLSFSTAVGLALRGVFVKTF